MTWQEFLTWPIASPGLMVAYGILAVLGLIAALRALCAATRTWWRYLVGVAAFAVLIWLILEVWWRPFPDRTPITVYLVWAAAVLALSTLVRSLFPSLRPAGGRQRGRSGAVRGRRKSARPALAAVATVCALIGAAGWTNCIYQQYPTLRSLNPVPAAKEMSYEEFRSTTQPPQIDGRPVGARVTVELPSSTSFTPRPAVAYVPPAYWQKPYQKLPVLMLMPGNPGRPDQWFTNGAAEETADDFQAQHGGASPIIVSVDGTGSLTANPACVGDSQTYVSEEAPAEIARQFTVDPDRSHWTIGGLSYGGTCALQVVTNHPRAFGSFLDFSGQAEPTLGTRKETVDKLFGGDESAFLAENPADLLRARRYDGIEGIFIAGKDDKEAVQALTGLEQRARAAGMRTSYHEVPGGHSFEVWRAALRPGLEFAAERGGIQ